MARWPFLFTFREKVSGNGFLADVVAQGRVLGVREDDEGIWMYGVNPGGLAAGGRDEGEAYLEFRKSYLAVLYDIAEDAQNLEDFKSQVQDFFQAPNKKTEEEWWGAVEEVRRGSVAAPGLPVKPADTQLFVEIRPIEHHLASDNTLEPTRAIAA